MKLSKLKLLTPVMGIGKIGTANWLTSAEVDMELRADGSIRLTRLSNGDPEIIVTPAAVAWYVPAEPGGLVTIGEGLHAALRPELPTIGEPQPHPAYPAPNPEIWSEPAPNKPRRTRKVTKPPT